MTYTVSSGTLNPTQLNSTVIRRILGTAVSLNVDCVMKVFWCSITSAMGGMVVVYSALCWCPGVCLCTELHEKFAINWPGSNLGGLWDTADPIQRTARQPFLYILQTKNNAHCCLSVTHTVPSGLAHGQRDVSLLPGCHIIYHPSYCADVLFSIIICRRYYHMRPSTAPTKTTTDLSVYSSSLFARWLARIAYRPHVRFAEVCDLLIASCIVVIVVIYWVLCFMYYSAYNINKMHRRFISVTVLTIWHIRLSYPTL